MANCKFLRRASTNFRLVWTLAEISARILRLILGSARILPEAGRQFLQVAFHSIASHSGASRSVASRSLASHSAGFLVRNVSPSVPLALNALFAPGLILAAPSPCPAQSISEPVLTEIVVHGASLPEPLRDVPGSTTVLSGDETIPLGADHFQDVIESIPNLNWAGGSSRPTFFQIRGIGEVEQYEGAPNPSVGIFLDDIDFSSLGGVASYFDIDQVEVLRGPQAIRYGANALAGVVAFRSKDPTPYVDSQVQLGLGSDSLTTAGAAVGGPVEGTSGTLQYRISAYQHRSDGFRDNLYLGRDDTNNRDELMGRLKLRYKPVAGFTADLTLLALDFDNGYDAFAIDNSLKTQSDRPGTDGQQTGAFGLRLSYDIDSEVTVSSLTTGSHSLLDYSYDGDWGNNPFWDPFSPYDYFSDTDRTRRIIGQEVRFSSSENSYLHGQTSRWTAGIFWQRLSERTELRNASDGAVYDFLDSRYVASTGAMFGEYEIPLADRTAVRVGGRAEQRESTYHDNRGNSEGPDDFMWGASVSLDHDYSDALRLYLAASRGFKGGGVNVSLNIPEAQRTFEPEHLYNFETGFKGAWLNDSLTWNTSLFAALRRDVQTDLSYQSDPNDPLTFTYITDNAARGWNTGLETEATYRPSPRWLVRIAGSLLDTEYTAADEANSALEGRQQSQSPHWQYSGKLRYQMNQYYFAEVGLTGKAAYYYQDSHNQRSSPYHLLNAAVGFESEHWGISVWGRNLSDEEYAVRGFYFGNEPPDFTPKEYIQRGDPLQVGTTLVIRF